MAFQKCQLDYWNGSAWVTAQTPANNNALISVRLDDKMGQPMRAEVKLANKFNNPFSSTASDARGNLSGVFTDFMKVRLVDVSTYAILFSGRIYKTNEMHDLMYGNCIELEAQDALAELKDNITDGHDDIRVSAGGGDTYPTLSAPNTTVNRRSGLIKGLISLFSKSGNIVFDDTNRFEASATAFESSTPNYPLKESGNEPALSHIASAAKDDPQTAAKDTVTYDFYVDPNFQSRASDHEPGSHFSYFKRGTRPSTTPSSNALRIEYPTGGGLTRTGRILPMMSDYEFTRPKSELFTEAVTHYLDEGPETVAGSTNKDKGWDAEEKLVHMELIKVKSISNGNAFVCKGKAIGGGVVGTDSSEYLTGNNAKIQWISANSGGSDSDPEFALISDITNDFPNTGTITGASSGSSFQIVSRPRETYGVFKIARLGATSIANADYVREQAVSRLKRSTDPIVRGRVRIMQKPIFYVDSTSTTVSGSVITFGDLNPLSYGFRIGMTVVKVNATGVVQSYGYASAVTSNSVTASMSASVSNGDTIRLYVPIRASDTAYIVNRLVNISGSDFLITEVNYAEDNGILNCDLSLVGTDSGLGPPQNTVGAAINAATNKKTYPKRGEKTAQSAQAKLTVQFSHHPSNGHTTINWTSGQLSVGGSAFSVSSGSHTFAAGEHYLYYPGSGTTFSASTVNAYTVNKDHVVVCWVRVNSTSDTDSYLEFKTIGGVNTSVPERGNAENTLNKRSILPSKELTSKAAQHFNANVVIKASGNALSTYAPAGGSAVTSFAVSFQESTSNTVTITGYSNPFHTLSADGDHFVFFDTSNNSLGVTATYGDAQTDTRGIIATVERVTSDGSKDALVFGEHSAESGDFGRLNKGLDNTGGSIGTLKNGLTSLGSSTVTFDTGASFPKVQLVDGGIIGKSNSSTTQFAIDAATGKGFFGASGACQIYDGGIFFPSNAAGQSASIQWNYNNVTWWLYRVTNSNKMFLTSSRSPVDVTEDFLALVGIGLGSANFRVPAGHFDALTIHNNTMSLGGQTFSAADVLLLTNGSTTDAQSLHTHGNLGAGSGDIEAVNISAGTDLTGTVNTSSGTHSQTINHENSAVSAGSYTNADITVNARGHITAASNGSGGGGHTHSTSLSISVDDITVADDVILTGVGGTVNGSSTGTISNMADVNTVTLHVDEIDNRSGTSWESAGSIDPKYNNFYDLGDSSLKWNEIYVTTVQEGSDSRIKTNIQDFSNADSLAFIDSLRPRKYNRLDNKGEAIDDLSYGLVAQEVEEALTGLGIDKTKVTMLNLPETETVMSVLEEGGEEVEVPNPRTLAYMQFVAPLIGAVKELKARIEILEGN